MDNKFYDEKDYVNINFNSIGELITEWDNVISVFEGSLLKAVDDPFLRQLNEAQLENDFSSSFDKGSSTVIENLRKISSGLSLYYDELMKTEESMKKDYYNFSGGSSFANNSGGSSSTSNSTLTSTPINTTPNQLATFNPSKIKEDDYKKMIESILKVQNVNLKLSELMKTTEGKKKLLNTILNSNISNDLKELLRRTDSDSILKYIITELGNTDNLEFDNFSSRIIRDFVDDMLRDNPNITPMEVRKNVVTSFDVVSNFLNDLSKDNNYQKDLLRIYDGDYDNPKLKSNDVGLIRKMLDFTAEETHKPTEEIITNTDNLKLVNNAVTSLKNSSSFLSVLNKCTDDYFYGSTKDLFGDLKEIKDRDNVNIT